MAPYGVTRVLRWTILFGTLGWLAIGCNQTGPPLVDVSGQVTLDGLPLTEGTVSFLSSSGKIASASLDEGGGFHLTCQYGNGVPLGDYQVAILPPPAADAKDPERMSGRRRAVPSASSIPVRYQRPESSGLSETIEHGPLRLKFDLTTP